MSAIRIRIQDIEIFKYVAPDQVVHLNDCATMVYKNKGDVVLMQGEPVTGIFVVSSGKVEVASGPLNASITTINPGEAIGEMSLLENTKASATIRAIENDTQLIVIHAQKFQEKITKNPLLAAGFYQGVSISLSKRLRDTTLRVSQEMAKRGKISQSMTAATGQSLSAEIGELITKVKDQRGEMIQDADTMLRAIHHFEPLIPRAEAPTFTQLAKDLKFKLDQYAAFCADAKQDLEQIQQMTAVVEKLFSSPTI